MAPACNCMYNDERCCRYRRPFPIWRIPSYPMPHEITTAGPLQFKPEEPTAGPTVIGDRNKRDVQHDSQ